MDGLHNCVIIQEGFKILKNIPFKDSLKTVMSNLV